MTRRYPNDELQKRYAVTGSLLMALTSVTLIYLTLFVWYPRTVS